MSGQQPASVSIDTGLVPVPQFNLMNLQNNINTLDMHSGNTANFNTAEGDGWSVNNLIRQGGSTMNVNPDMGNANTSHIRN